MELHGNLLVLRVVGAGLLPGRQVDDDGDEVFYEVFHDVLLVVTE